MEWRERISHPNRIHYSKSIAEMFWEKILFLIEIALIFRKRTIKLDLRSRMLGKDD